jgi:serine/threonine-protein kinase
MRAIGAVAVVLVCVLMPVVAHAQDASRESEAEALFEQGRKLAAEGRWAEACPKFAASQSADPGAGTLLNLANCYEQSQKTASAWATFKEAASMAKQQARADWEELARTRAAALEPRLSKLVIVVPDEARTEDLLITRDGVAVAPGAWSTPLPLDPQAHLIEARAPGKLAWSKTVTLAPDGAVLTVTVPRLEDAPRPRPDSRGNAPGSDPGATQRTVGIVAASVGAAALVVGSVAGILAINKESDSRARCANDACSDPAGLQANDDARSLARVSTIAFVAGGALVAAGAVLWLSAPRAPTPTTGPGLRGAARAPASPDRGDGLRLAPDAGPHVAGLVVAGAW